MVKHCVFKSQELCFFFLFNSIDGIIQYIYHFAEHLLPVVQQSYNS